METSSSPSFIDKLQMEPQKLWENYKLFFIVFGLLILVIKFRSTIMDLLFANQKQVFQETVKKSDSLKEEEIVLNTKANSLVEESKSLDSSKNPIDESWNLKK